MKPMKQFTRKQFQAWGKIGGERSGKVITPAKIKAAKENGRKGGRPKKMVEGKSKK